jgi:hypothetical protein
LVLLNDLGFGECSLSEIFSPALRNRSQFYKLASQYSKWKSKFLKILGKCKSDLIICILRTLVALSLIYLVILLLQSVLWWLPGLFQSITSCHRSSFECMCFFWICLNLYSSYCINYDRFPAPLYLWPHRLFTYYCWPLIANYTHTSVMDCTFY